MSYTGHSDVLDVSVGITGITTTSFVVDAAEEWSWHRHDVDELLWGSRGSLMVETPHGFHAVPWTMGLWIPAGERHRVMASPGTEFACTYLSPQLGPPPRTDAGAVGVSAAVRALLEELGTREVEPSTRRLAERLLLRLLDRADTVRLNLRLPEDDRARRIADAVRRDSADTRTLREWGAIVGASERNLSRLFRQETSLSFAQWRTRARMLAAVEMLAARTPVGAVGRRVGYATPSAFVQAFRRELGTTPGAFAGRAQ